MLGNSSRELTPVDKRRPYIVNTLPILAYGMQLWWHLEWKAKRWILKSLQSAQNEAARWITRKFHTTPTGALEMMAGLLLIRHQIDK